ncbi:MAG TPA: glycosyltransferase [Stellaceae bacterium]|nr:glycosyltransferase [Stellaceae bacterium]
MTDARPKILHLITGLARGGAQTMLTELVTHLDRSRFESVVVSLIDGGIQAEAIAAAGVRVMGLGMRPGLPSLGAIRRLRAIVAAETPALIQSWLYHADLMALVAARGVPVAWNIRLSSIEGAPHQARLRILQRILAVLSRRPACVMVNSAAGRRFHEALGYRPRRWEVVANGFDVTRFRPDPQRRTEARRRLGIDEMQRAIGMVARVDGMKDHATFLAAAERVASRRDDARFVLIGAGTEELPVPPGLVKIIAALGERSDVAEILPALDLMVLSSFSEGFPNAIGEAMACGIPCVASDVGDVGALVGETGLLVPPRDPGALADAILGLLAREPDHLAALGRAARARILASYSIEAAARRYEAIWTELIADGN